MVQLSLPDEPLQTRRLKLLGGEPVVGPRLYLLQWGDLVCQATTLGKGSQKNRREREPSKRALVSKFFQVLLSRSANLADGSSGGKVIVSVLS